jgi:hypothetical protein
VAWLIHSEFLINWDVSWDMRIANRMLAGGTYVKDFFDTNPPLILFLYMPAVLLSKILPITIMTALRAYVFALATLALVFCYQLASKIFSLQDYVLKIIFLLTIAIFFLIMPIMELGEREHLMMMFTMPYFLLVTRRLEGQNINRYYALAIGLFAALGFAIKPYFVIAFALTELYYLVNTRRFFSWVRPESLAIILFLIFYLIAIFVFYPTYIATIVPLGMMFYYSGFSDTWTRILLEAPVLFCGLAVLLYTLQRKASPHQALSSILLMATLGFLLSYLVQRTSWRYHYLPAFFTAALLMIVLLADLLSVKYKKVFSYAVIYLFASWMLTFPANYIRDICEYGNMYKTSFNSLINYLQVNAANKSVFFISASPNEFFPAVDYVNVIYNSRFQHLFWIPGVLKQTLQIKDGKLPAYKIKGEQAFVNMITQDISKIQPDLIFVDVKDIKPFFQMLYLDYLQYLSHDQQFQTLWKNYRYQTTIEATVYDLGDTNKWQLYAVPEITELDPKKISSNSVVLTGTGAKRIAYYVHNQEFLSSQVGQFVRNVQLSPAELTYIQAQPATGAIARTAENKQLVDHIVNNAMIVYNYKYAVYQRLA